MEQFSITDVDGLRKTLRAIVRTWLDNPDDERVKDLDPEMIGFMVKVLDLWEPGMNQYEVLSIFRGD
jgi:hypothetical protein